MRIHTYIHIYIYIYIYIQKKSSACYSRASAAARGPRPSERAGAASIYEVHTFRSSRMWCLRMWCLIIIGVTLSYTYILPTMGSHN